MTTNHFSYLKKFSDICNQLDDNGINSIEFGSFGMARKYFGQFVDDIENNDENAAEELDLFKRALDHLQIEIADKKKNTAQIEKYLQELRSLPDFIVNTHSIKKN